MNPERKIHDEDTVLNVDKESCHTSVIINTNMKKKNGEIKKLDDDRWRYLLAKLKVNWS